MAPRSILAQLVVALKDDASGPAKALAGTLKGLEKSAVDFAKTMNGAKWGSSFTRQLGNLKATQDEIGQIKKSWGDLQAQLSGAGAKGRLKTDAQRQWANEWVSRLQAVRIADQQNTEEAIRNTKKRLAEERRAEAVASRERLRLAREEDRSKQRAAKEAAANERRAARESSRVAREAAREQVRLTREQARQSRQALRDQAREARVAERAAIRAERVSLRADRGTTRGARAVGRAVLHNAAAALGIGGGAYFAGRAARAGTRAGGEAMREDARDYLAGLTPEQSGRLSSLAVANSGNYKSLTSTNLHALYRETAMTSLNMEGAAAIAPDLAKGMVVLQSLKGKDEALRQLTGFMRALDTLGKNVEPSVVRNLLDGMARAAGVQGVEYDPAKIFTFAKQARSAGGALGPEFINTVLPSLIADMGPAGPGTGLATFMSSVVGGTLSGGNTKKKLLLQKQWGLRGDDNRLSAADRDLATTAPHRYAWERVMPALIRQGVDVDNEGAVQEALNRLYTRTVADLFGKMITQRQQYQATQKKLGLAPGLDGAAGLDTKDPFVAAEGVISQMTNTAAEISTPIIKTILPALNGLSGGLNTLAQRLRDNPEFAKDFGVTGATGGGAGLLGALIGGGRAFLSSGTIAGAIRGGASGGLWGALIGTVVGALGPDILSFVTGETGRATAGQKSMNAITPDAWERSRRVKDEYLRDPEGARGRAMMRLGAGDGSASSDGQATGSAFASGVASGVASQAPAVEAQGMSILDRLKSIFSSGADIPVRISGRDIVGNVLAGRPAGDVGPTDPAAPARASGGSVAAGGLYRVNEFGEEFFQPTEDGRIIDPRRSAGGPGATGSKSISLGGLTFHINGVSDPSAVADSVVQILDQKIQEIARGAFADMGVELA